MFYNSLLIQVLQNYKLGNLSWPIKLLLKKLANLKTWFLSFSLIIILLFSSFTIYRVYKFVLQFTIILFSFHPFNLIFLIFRYSINFLKWTNFIQIYFYFNAHALKHRRSLLTVLFECLHLMNLDLNLKVIFS